MAEAAREIKRGWIARLKAGLSRSSARLGGGVGAIFTGRKLDDEALTELEDLLISADLGTECAAELTQALAKSRFGKEVSAEEVRVALAHDIERILEPVARPLEIDRDLKPQVILFAGVNGTGKTTTIGKLAHRFRAEGRSVLLVAADTFRAAATEQLQIWGERSGCPVMACEKPGGDAAGLVFDALQAARAERRDVVLIDTAGRVQTKKDLMAELEKIVRVIKKVDAAAPHDAILVLDATVGQNAHSQLEAFGRAIDVSGLVLTKLDGTAKGGVVVALAKRFGVPVHAIGVGEELDDLRPFEAGGFARALLGLEE